MASSPQCHDESVEYEELLRKFEAEFNDEVAINTRQRDKKNNTDGSETNSVRSENDTSTGSESHPKRSSRKRKASPTVTKKKKPAKKRRSQKKSDNFSLSDIERSKRKREQIDKEPADSFHRVFYTIKPRKSKNIEKSKKSIEDVTVTKNPAESPTNAACSSDQLSSSISSKERPPMHIVSLARRQCARPIRLTNNNMTAIGEKGYRMVRCSHGVSEGDWYFEIRIDPPRVSEGHSKDDAHVRLGWSTDKGDLDAPVGFDRFSYGYRDVNGDKCHLSIRRKYGGTYTVGDVIGCFISLPPLSEKIRLHQHLLTKEQRQVQTLPGSKIEFYKNGVSQGVAYENILLGQYHPAVSLFNGATVTFDFDPTFPANIPDWRCRPIGHLRHGLQWLPPLKPKPAPSPTGRRGGRKKRRKA